MATEKKPRLLAGATVQEIQRALIRRRQSNALDDARGPSSRLCLVGLA